MLHWSHCVLIALLLDTMPKRKLFNIANLGAWAKSTVTKSTKENVSNCTEILKKLLTFHRLTPLNQHHPARRRRSTKLATHPCFTSGPWAGHRSIACHQCVNLPALSLITKRSWSHQQCIISTWECPSCQYGKVCNSIMLVCRCLPTWSYWKASRMGQKNILRASCDAQDPPSWLR